MFKTALLRRTAPSCYENDWYNLEKDVCFNKGSTGCEGIPSRVWKSPPTKATYPLDVGGYLVSKFVALGSRLEKL
jgi:hypothetical protein